MDHQQFDVLTRRWATHKSRRTTLKALTGLAAAGILALNGRGDAMADRCKHADKPCKKNKQCCDGRVCVAGRCQDRADLMQCGSDNPCPTFYRLICGAANGFEAVENPCLDGYCAFSFSSRPPQDPCCKCTGRACIVSSGTCCALEQVCQDKKGNYVCCPGMDYCGTDGKGEVACLSPDRACTVDDTSACFEGESCAAGVCCPEARACPNQCCGFNCACLDGLCACDLQAGIRRY